MLERHFTGLAMALPYGEEQSWPGASLSQTGLALHLSRHNRILIAAIAGRFLGLVSIVK